MTSPAGSQVRGQKLLGKLVVWKVGASIAA